MEKLMTIFFHIIIGLSIGSIIRASLMDPTTEKHKRFVDRLQEFEYTGGDEFCFEEDCMLISANRSTWEAAYDECREWGGYIAQYITDEELYMVVTVMQVLHMRKMWLGATLHIDRSGENQPRNCPEDYDNKPNPPNHGGRKHPPGFDDQGDDKSHEKHQRESDLDCLRVTIELKNDNWTYMEHTCDCASFQPSVCFIRKDSQSLCPAGYTRCAGDFCFMRIRPEPWPLAWQKCEGNMLPIVGNEEKILEQIGDCQLDNGRSDWKLQNVYRTWTTRSALSWVWNKTGEPVTQMRWADMYPHVPVRHCVVISQEGKWSDVRCNDLNDYICLKYNPDYIPPEADHPNQGLDNQGNTVDASNCPIHWIFQGKCQTFPIEAVVIIVCTLIVAVIVIVACLAFVMIKLRREFKKTRAVQMSQQREENIYQGLSRSDSIYENDGDIYNVYLGLDPQSESGNIYTISDVPSPTTSQVSEEDLQRFKLRPRKGSLPAPPTPDVVPTKKRKNSALNFVYLQLIPSPYGKVAAVKEVPPSSQFRRQESLYADKPLPQQVTPDPELTEESIKEEGHSEEKLSGNQNQNNDNIERDESAVEKETDIQEVCDKESNAKEVEISEITGQNEDIDISQAKTITSM